MCAGQTRRQGSGLLAEDHLVRELGLSICDCEETIRGTPQKIQNDSRDLHSHYDLVPLTTEMTGFSKLLLSVRYGSYSIVNIHARVMPSAWWVSPECQPCPPIPTSAQPGKKVDWTEVGWRDGGQAGQLAQSEWELGVRREPSCGGNCKGDTPWVDAGVQAGLQGALHGSEIEFAFITQTWNLLEVLVVYSVS